MRYSRHKLKDVFWFQEGPGVRNTQFRDAGIKLLNVANITKAGEIDLSKTDRHLEADEVAKKYSHFLVDESDLVIPSSGISIDEDNLLRTRAAFIESKHLPLCMNTSTIRFKAKSGISDLRYLKWWLDAKPFRTQITRLVTGSAQKNFGPSHLERIEIDLPSLDEQRRIAAILDQADALRRKRRRTIELLENFIVSKFLTMFSKPLGRSIIGVSETCASLPDGWQWRRLQTVADMKSGHTPSRKIESYWNGGAIPWLTLGDIRNLDGKIVTETTEHITSEGLDNSSAVMLPRDTVCFARTASVGFVTVAGIPLATSQDFVNWICGELIDPYFLMWAFIATRKELIALAPGSTHHTIYFRLFELLHMAVPPIALQKQFLKAAKAVEAIKVIAEAQSQATEALFHSLQDRAFGHSGFSADLQLKTAAE